MGMVDITGKSSLLREAEARGRIELSPGTIDRIRANQIRKGDPLLVAEIAGMNAAKGTCLLIPHCHQIPLNNIEFNFSLEDNFIDVRCVVRAEAMTGVEMEAVVGISIALSTIWDMVKYLEKDEGGQYPHTSISDIKVIKKIKKPVPRKKAKRK